MSTRWFSLNPSWSQCADRGVIVPFTKQGFAIRPSNGVMYLMGVIGGVTRSDERILCILIVFNNEVLLQVTNHTGQAEKNLLGFEPWDKVAGLNPSMAK